MLINNIISRFENVKKTGNKYRVTCPCHGSSKNQGLIVFDHGDKIGLHCFAECQVDDILGAIGLTMSDLYDNTLTNEDWRDIEYEKRKVREHESDAHKLFVAVSIIRQSLIPRLFGGDPQIEGKFEAYDMEKQALHKLPILLKKYYK